MPANNGRLSGGQSPCTPRRRRRLVFESLEARELLATFLVNSISTLRDSKIDGVCDVDEFQAGLQCNLRAAVEEANANSDLDTIRIDSTVTEIPSNAFFPNITNPIALEGTSAEAVSILQSLNMSGGSSVLRNVTVNANVSMTGGNHQVYGTRVGTGNLYRTLSVSGNNNRIGGPNAEERNILRGLSISGDNNRVQGNYIGIDASGTSPLPALSFTVGNAGLSVAGKNNLIGGSSPGEGNVVSGHANAGIEVFDVVSSSADGNLIVGNTIGLNAAGNAKISNGVGINISQAVNTEIRDNRIGGSAGSAGFNQGAGILVGLASTGTIIEKNQIGVAQGLGNRGPGIEIASNGNSVGGTNAQAGNIIAHNDGDGVLVRFGEHNSIRRNSIFGNGGLGINLKQDRFGADDGVTLNDSKDQDSGTASDGGNLANSLQNFPQLTVESAGRLIGGTLHSIPSTVFELDFFSNDSPDPTGYGEGQTYLGSLTVMTDNSGNTAPFQTSFAVPSGKSVSATATDPMGNTSEFSKSPLPPIVVNSSRDLPDSSTVDERCDTGETIVVNGQIFAECTLRAAIEQSNALSGSVAIHFNIAGPSKIEVLTNLPPLRNSIIIDGTTDPDYVDVPVIEIRSSVDGAGLQNQQIGLELQGNNSRVSGLTISGFFGTKGTGVLVSGGTNTLLERLNVVQNFTGIQIFAAQQVTIGGTVGNGNMIANNEYGIELLGANDNVVQGNFIGIDRDGSRFGNQLLGVWIHNSSNNVIGGTPAGANQIRFNTIGVLVGEQDDEPPRLPSLGNLIRNNVIAENRELGIDLNLNAFGGPNRINDEQDTDTGPNGLQNHPALVGAAIDRGNQQDPNDDVVVITGGLTAKTGETYILEFFASSSCSTSQFGQGEISLGTVPLQITQSNGRDPFIISSLNLDRDPEAGQYITATATDAVGNTSEFSRCVVVNDVDRDGQLETAGVDGNRDGVEDSTQPHVATFATALSQQATLVATTGMQITLAGATPNPSPNNTPNVTFPMGFVTFGLANLEPGSKATLDLQLPSGITADSYFLYGPTLDNPIPHWFEFTFDGTTGAQIQGDKIKLHFVDGGRGDLDLLADGEILDPGGPAIFAAALPPWQNPNNPLDADDDGTVQPLDALLVINRLNEVGSQVLPTPTSQFAPPPYYDVDGDGSIAPIDVLLIINFLNRASGEPESWLIPTASLENLAQRNKIARHYGK